MCRTGASRELSAATVATTIVMWIASVKMRKAAAGTGSSQHDKTSPRKSSRLPSAAPTAGAGRRARKFPLTLQPTGRFCRKIQGKIHYLGRGKQEALRRHHEQASALCAGTRKFALSSDRLTLERRVSSCQGAGHRIVLAFPSATPNDTKSFILRVESVAGARSRRLAILERS